MPNEAEALGLLALMLFHDSRREARTTGDDLVLLEDQDRTLWDESRIEEGRRVLDRAASLRRIGPYQLQAAVAAVHAGETDWPAVAALYERLAWISPSPIVDLNRAVAVAMVEGADRGLDLVDRIEGLNDLHHLLHAARADLLRRLDRREEAAEAYEQALELATNAAERRFLGQRHNAQLA